MNAPQTSRKTIRIELSIVTAKSSSEACFMVSSVLTNSCLNNSEYQLDIKETAIVGDECLYNTRPENLS